MPTIIDVDVLVKICPCNQCLCVPICKRIPTSRIRLIKCSLAREFYKEDFPYRHYYRFVAIRKALGIKLNYPELYDDWYNLLQYSHRSL
jgi:hypothetical protein